MPVGALGGAGGRARDRGELGNNGILMGILIAGELECVF